MKIRINTVASKQHIQIAYCWSAVKISRGERSAGGCSLANKSHAAETEHVLE